MARLKIIWEDDDIIAVDKPAGMIVHPAPGHETGTLSDALLAHCPGMANVGSRTRPGIVHRLDQETSGVLVAAKTPRAYRALRQRFETHTGILKSYLAVVHGAFTPKKGTIDVPIGRKPWDAKRMAVNVPGALRAVTHWEQLAKTGSIALVEFTIDTGRTHQIRVHSAHAGHPIVGDALYGDKTRDAHLRNRPTRMLLHAAALIFKHPFTHKQLSLIAEVPPEIAYA